MIRSGQGDGCRAIVPLLEPGISIDAADAVMLVILTNARRQKYNRDIWCFRDRAWRMC